MLLIVVGTLRVPSHVKVGTLRVPSHVNKDDKIFRHPIEKSY